MDARFKESSPSFELSEQVCSGQVGDAKSKESSSGSGPSEQIRSSYPKLESLDAGAMTGHRGA